MTQQQTEAMTDPDRTFVGDFEALAPGMRRVVEVDGQQVVVFVESDGFFALRDACPHYGVALSDGRCDGQHVLCGWHGWHINIRTGACAHQPLLRAETWVTEVVDGRVYVNRKPAGNGS